ncbi:MAG TPA: PadR family transcriptional regulator [Acidobacteriota bacterium]|nr:PadR family transcriptional regulator [Acidobacteriota bacterium]
MPRTTSEPEANLPLRPVVFSILVVLREAPLHGYGIMQQANEHVGQQAILGPGTLYRTLKELRAQGLIEHTDVDDGEDARRQYYRLTPAGNEVAAAEARRLADLVRRVDVDLAMPAQETR